MLAVGLSLVSTPAYAYLDPGSGSMILQIIVGAVVAAGAGAKIFWQNIVDFFSRTFGGNKSDNSDS